MRTEEYKQLLDSLKKNAETICTDGLTVEVRNCADRKKGAADPRSAAAARVTREDFALHRELLHPELRANETHLLGLEDPENHTMLERLRAQFGWISSDLSTGIRTIRHDFSEAEEPFCLYQYEQISDRTDRPCLIFIHGGGYFGGNTETVENQCKLLAQLSDGVVFSVDYPLCPEHPYPAGLHACFHAVKWVFCHAESLGISKDRIGVAGDSAGGNLSLGCVLMDRAEGTHMLSYEALIYPGVDMRECIDTPLYWNPDSYDNPEHDPLIDKQIREIGAISNDVISWYLPQGTDLKEDTVSPICADLSILPKTLLISAEYDFLRGSAEALAKKLNDAGVENRYIRYGGIFHGTFDRLGYAPQVEDILLEIAADLKTL